MRILTLSDIDSVENEYEMRLMQQLPQLVFTYARPSSALSRLPILSALQFRAFLCPESTSVSSIKLARHL